MEQRLQTFAKLLKDNCEQEDKTRFKKRRKKSDKPDKNDMSFFFQMIPLDLHEEIISYIPFQEIFKNISRVCKFWNEIVKKPDGQFYKQSSMNLISSHRFKDSKFFEKFTNLKEITFVLSIPCVEWLKNNSSTLESLQFHSCNVKENILEFWTTLSEIEGLRELIFVQSTPMLQKVAKVKLLKIESLTLSRCLCYNHNLRSLFDLVDENLQELNLIGCHYISDEIFDTMATLKLFPQKLNFSGWRIGSKKLKQYCLKSKNLIDLDVSNDKGYVMLTNDFFEATPQLLKLSLKGNPSFLGGGEFLKAMKPLSSLQELDISGDFIYGLDINETFMHSIRRSLPSLKYLITNEGKFEIFKQKFYKV